MTTGRLRAAGWGLALLAALPALAAEGDWETVATGPITVKARARPGSPVKEVWAEGPLNAQVQDIQAALMDGNRLAQFMPYVKEARTVGPPQPDGSQVVYQRIDLPILSSRDYVLKVYLDQGTAPDGSGEFKSHWVPTNMLPERAHIVRLKTNDGSWHVKPTADGKSWAVYKFTTDPGGLIPAFAANMGTKGGVDDLFKAVEKEAHRRAAERKADAGS